MYDDRHSVARMLVEVASCKFADIILPFIIQNGYCSNTTALSRAPLSLGEEVAERHFLETGWLSRCCNHDLLLADNLEAARHSPNHFEAQRSNFRLSRAR